MESKQKNLNTGAIGEREAARRLRTAGYKILHANYHSRFGEIDLIASNDKYIVFVEVKTRTSKNMILAREAVTQHKQEKIIKTAKFFLLTHDYDLQPRFDVVEVYMDKKGTVTEYTHFENAFEVKS